MQMAMTTAAPATHSQPSRKSKRAWRKNIDIEPVTSGLEDIRDEYRQTGRVRDFNGPADDLYRIDLTGDPDITRRAQKPQRKLKVDEILGARSKVPAVTTRKNLDSNRDGILKRKRDAETNSKERARLWRLANSGGKTASHGVVEGMEAAAYDPWETSANTPLGPNQSFLDAKQPIREPDTLRQGPLSMTTSGKSVPSIPKPHAGRSYNPQFEDWSNLVKREGERELRAEKERQRLAASEREKEERVAIAAAEAEQEERDRAVMSEHESEWEGFQSEADEVQLNAKRPERKTPAERNKINRRKAALGLEKHESRMRLREKQEKQIDAIAKAVEAEQQGKLAAQTFEGFSGDEDMVSDEEDIELARRSRFGKKFRPLSQDLELILPDELQDSLRLLKPEGNLLKDRYRTMVLQGKTEGRSPLPMQKKAKRKETEKWSYKDWSLDQA